MWVYKYDENGFFLTPVELKEGEEIPLNCTRKAPPIEGHYRSKFDEELDAWVEGRSQEEIQQLKQTSAPDVIEELKKENQLLKLQLEQTNADIAAFMDYVTGGS